MRFFSYRHIDRDGLTRRLRELLGQETQAQVAERLGIRQGYVSRYLRGAVPHPEVLAAIAEQYSVSLDWLLLGRGPKCPPQGAYASVLGCRLRTIREVLGLHLAEFAEVLQLRTVTELEAIERGECEAPRQLLDRVAERWNISHRWLIAGDGGMFACFGDGSSLGTVREVRRLLAAGLVDILWVLRTSTVGAAPLIGFVAGHQPSESAPTNPYVYYIVKGSSSTAVGTMGLAAVKEILCDCWELGVPPVLGYDLVPELFHALVQGLRYPATIIPGRAVDFFPIETFLTTDELAVMHSDREARRELREVGETLLSTKRLDVQSQTQTSVPAQRLMGGGGRLPGQTGRGRRKDKSVGDRPKS